MDRIDLHAHTTQSDGTLTPGELVRLAADLGLRAVAVTDHDTTAGWAEAEEAGRACRVEILPGCEITARFPSRSMHILAYGFAAREKAVSEMLAQVRGGRETRNPRILARLAEMGVRVSMDEVKAAAAGEVIGRPHIAKVMVAKGYVPDVKAAFSLYLKDGGPAYVAQESVEPSEVIATVKDAGGVTVLAHPKQLRLDGAPAYEALVSDLAAKGLGGIEVHHPSQDGAQRAMFAGIARRFSLVESAGSDFHGANKPDIVLGSGDGTIVVGYEIWEALRARCAARGA